MGIVGLAGLDSFQNGLILLRNFQQLTLAQLLVQTVEKVNDGDAK